MAIKTLLDQRYMDADLGEPFYYEPQIEEIISQLPPSVVNSLVSQEVAQAPIQEVRPAPTTVSKQDTINALTKQILASSDTSKWTGGVDAETAAKDMAKIMAGIGITDISQFGKVTQTGLQEEVRPDGRGGFVTLKGQPVDPSIVKTETISGEFGELTSYIAPIGTQEVYGNKQTGQVVPITYSERQTGNAFGGTFEGKGNTGYRVNFDDSGKPIFYTTGASSNDLFNLLSESPILNAAATYAAYAFGGPAGVAVLNAAQGKSAEDVAKATALSYAGGELSKAISPYLPSLPTANIPIDFVGGTPDQINEALNANFVKDLKAAGVGNVSEFINNVGGNAFTLPTDTVQVTAPSAPPTPTVAPSIDAVINSIAQQTPNTVEVTAPKVVEPTITDVISKIVAQQPIVTPVPDQPVFNGVISEPVPNLQVTAPQTPVAPTIADVISSIAQAQVTPQPVVPEIVKTAEKQQQPEQPVIPVVTPTPTVPELQVVGDRPITIEPPSSITEPTTPIPIITPTTPIDTTLPEKKYTTKEIIDMVRLGMLGASVLGAGAVAQNNGPTQFDIVPVPEDWKSPIYQKDLPFTAQTQLTPIDFNNRNLLIGTQWEKLLDPNYGKVAQPVQFNQPSNMSYDRLMSILGTGRDVLPSQALSINDVISGIQNQYGQTPTSSMG